jgi:sec-independent protein translocase protein TatA
MRIGPFGVWEILIILIVVLLIFGPRRLPEMAKGLGQSVRLFRKEMRDFKADLEADGSAPARPQAQPAPAPAQAQASSEPSGTTATAPHVAADGTGEQAASPPNGSDPRTH